MKKLVLENGVEMEGVGFGSGRDSICEIVLNTSMVGYQEIISDPTYAGQTVVMTYPLIGNYGITDEDYESRNLGIGGIIVREYCDSPSNFRYTKTLSEFLEENDIPGIAGVDTRRLACIIRDEGTMKALITSSDTPHEKAMEMIRSHELPDDMVSRVSCRKKWYSRTASPRFNVVAVDCGIKLGLVRTLNKYGCNVTVVPHDTPYEDIARLAPDGVIISDGPGSPDHVPHVQELIRKLRGNVPMFAVGLGMQLVALAFGGKTVKLPRGHRGSNHPVKNIITGKVAVTGQNHGHAVAPESLEGTGLEVTHVNVTDGSAEGMMDRENRIFCFQYNPEAIPGSPNSVEIFTQLIRLMEGGQLYA